MSAVSRGSDNGEKTIAAWPLRAMAAVSRRGADRPRAQSTKGHRLSGALCRAGIYLDLPGHRPARFRAHGDRLCAGAMAAGVEIPKTLRRELSQSRRLS